ncbi:MAG: phosphate/phosphite/phosphonate ABC transporter substrate-binding protein [Cyclobacteriaceae bacterium]
MKNKIVIGLLLSIVFLVNGCHRKSEPTSDIVPTELFVAMHGGEKPAQFKAAWEPLRLHLEKKLGVKVKFFFTSDYTSIIQALRSKKVHMADIPPFAYIIATQKPGLSPIVTMGLNGAPAMYKSFIFTNPQTGIKTIEDLKTNSGKLTLCFSDPASTSGHLIPRAYLMSIGLDPLKSFGETKFCGTHAATLLSVKTGKVDIGCASWDLSYAKLLREGMVKESEIVELWRSPAIINNCVVVRDEINKEFVQKVKDIFLNAASDDYNAFKTYANLYYPDPSHMSYIPVADSSYNSLRKIAGSLADINLLDKK